MKRASLSVIVALLGFAVAMPGDVLSLGPQQVRRFRAPHDVQTAAVATAPRGEEDCDPPALMLRIQSSQDECLRPGESVTVVLSMSCTPVPVRGYQAFLQFDTNLLTFVSGSYNIPGPFNRPILTPIHAYGGEISLASGIDDFGGQAPRTEAADLAYLRFTAGSIDGFMPVVFRPNDPPTRFSDINAQPLVPALTDSPTIMIDGTPPEIVCPPDVMQDTDPASCTAVVMIGQATASDGFGSGVASITPVRSDGLPTDAPYPVGTTTITWTAEDACGNTAECVQYVTVNPANDIMVAVELASITNAPVRRCITFELFDCNGGPLEIIEQTFEFTNKKATGMIPAHCGAFTCITARDRLHTLRRNTTDFALVGSHYVADFTNRLALGGDDNSLVGGNLNDDDFIDILDFGLFAGQFTANFGSGDTDCSTPFWHADISGNGSVFLDDYTFIQINFLRERDPNCCDRPDRGDGPNDPVVRISVDELMERGLSDLATADYNGDGFLDFLDIAAFMQENSRSSSGSP